MNHKDSQPAKRASRPLPHALILIRNHAFDFGSVRIADQYSMAQLLFTLVRLGSQHVAQVRMAALHLPSCSFLEALGGAFMSFQLWHRSSEIAASIQQSVFSEKRLRAEC